jgi:hypothetical protein
MKIHITHWNSDDVHAHWGLVAKKAIQRWDGQTVPYCESEDEDTVTVLISIEGEQVFHLDSAGWFKVEGCIEENGQIADFHAVALPETPQHPLDDREEDADTFLPLLPTPAWHEQQLGVEGVPPKRALVFGVFSTSGHYDRECELALAHALRAWPSTLEPVGPDDPPYEETTRFGTTIVKISADGSNAWNGASMWPVATVSFSIEGLYAVPACVLEGAIINCRVRMLPAKGSDGNFIPCFGSC